MKDLTAVYTYEYNLMKRQIKVQSITIALLILLSMISVFYNMRLTIDNKELKEEYVYEKDL